MAQLDNLLPKLATVFQKKGGVAGQKLARHLKSLDEANDVHLRREAIIKALCLYLCEDDGFLIKEYINVPHEDFLKDQHTAKMGIYVTTKEGGALGEHNDIGIVIDGDIILDNMKSVAQACALMLGVIYALIYELKYYYEFVQKVLMHMDGSKLSPKVLGLKNKISG